MGSGVGSVLDLRNPVDAAKRQCKYRGGREKLHVEKGTVELAERWRFLLIWNEGELGLKVC